MSRTEVFLECQLVETLTMAAKRTKADKAQRQDDQLEKKTERQPEQGTSTKRPSKKALADPLNPSANPIREI